MMTDNEPDYSYRTTKKSKMTVSRLPANEESRIPVPRRASEELPDAETMCAFAIPLDDVGEARLVACTLSRFLGRGHAESRSQLQAMMVALSICSVIDVVHEGE